MNADYARTLLLIGLSFAPATAFARHPHYAPFYGYGTVSVHNDTPSTITIDLGGQVRTLPPQMTAALTVPAGSARLSASYVLYGQSRSLPRQELAVAPGQHRWVEVDTPAVAVVQVRNELPQVGAIYADGVYLGSVAPFGTELVSMRAGPHEMSLRVDGRVVECERVVAAPMREARMVVEAPRFADVMVQNPLPIPVVISTDRGVTRTARAYGSVILDDVAVGTQRIIARRTTGEVVDEATVSVRAYGSNAWVVDAPRTGLVRLDNDTERALDVYASGRKVATLAPEQASNVLLPVGWTELSLRDCHGREVESAWVEVEAFELARLDIDDRRHERAYAEGRGGHDRDGDAHRRPECEDGRC